MTRDTLTWAQIVEADRDIAEVCTRIDRCEPGTLTMQRLGEMLDALMARKKALLEGRPPP
jgi:hypothetical protein